MNLEWAEPEQQVLDASPAWAAMNKYLVIADFLLGQGAGIKNELELP